MLDNLSPFAGLQSDPPDLLEVGQLDLLDRPDRLDLVDQLDQPDLLDSERQEQLDLMDQLDRLDLPEVDQLDRPDLREVDQLDQLDQQVLLEVAGDRPGRWEILDQIHLSMVVQELPSGLLDLLEVSIG